MASLKFPLSVAQKQQVLYLKPLPPAELSAWGRTYQEAGLPHDALEFFDAAKDSVSLESLGHKAVESADLVLYLNACRALGAEPARDRLETLRQRALSSGMEAVAKRASTFLAQKS